MAYYPPVFVAIFCVKGTFNSILSNGINLISQFRSMMLRTPALICFLGLFVTTLSCSKSVEKNPLAEKWHSFYIIDSYINPYTGVMVKDTVNDLVRSFIEFKSDGTFNLGDDTFSGTYNMTDTTATTRFTSPTFPAVCKQVQHFSYTKADAKTLYMKSEDVNISVSVFNPNYSGEFQYAQVIFEEIYFVISN